MAINPDTQYPGQVEAPDANYPYGGAKNETTPSTPTVPGSLDGTPFEAALLNDIFGFQQALLTEAAIVPSGNAETAIASQYLQALQTLFAQLAVVGEWSAQQYFATVALVDGANITWDLDDEQSAKVTIAGNRTLDNPTNLQEGGQYQLIVTQDGVGGRTLAYDTVYKFPGGTAPTLSTDPGAVDILTFVSDGTNMYGVGVLNLS